MSIKYNKTMYDILMQCEKIELVNSIEEENKQLLNTIEELKQNQIVQ